MIGLAVACAFTLADEALPKLDTIDRFPVQSTAQEQAERCTEHLDRLRCLRAVWGWSGGLWDEAIADTEHARHYWTLLYAARDQFGLTPSYQRACLLRLKQHIGPKRYLDGWRPPEIPPAARFDPPVMPPAPP